MKRTREESHNNSDVGGGVRKLSKKDAVAKSVLPEKVNKLSSLLVSESEGGDDSENELKRGRPREAGNEKDDSDSSDDSVYYDNGQGVDLDRGSDSSGPSDSDSGSSPSDSGSNKPEELPTTTTATPLPINLNDPPPRRNVLLLY